MTLLCTPLHDTLQVLAEGFAHAIVLAVREVSVSELARELAGRTRRAPGLSRLGFLMRDAAPLYAKTDTT